MASRLYLFKFTYPVIPFIDTKIYLNDYLHNNLRSVYQNLPHLHLHCNSYEDTTQTQTHDPQHQYHRQLQVKIIAFIKISWQQKNQTDSFPKKMTTASSKVLPQLSNFKSYNAWYVWSIYWQSLLTSNLKRQRSALVISLSGKALEATLELQDKDISSQHGVKLIVEKLTSYTKKDELHEKFQDLETLNPMQEPLT